MKKLLSILALLISLSTFAQPVQRSSDAVLPMDGNLLTKLSFKMPVLDDTTQANAIAKFDSAGKMIYSKVDRSVYVREIPPRRWSKLFSSSNNTSTYYGIDSITYSNGNICQWQSGVPLCYNIISPGTPSQGIDSVTVRNDSLCEHKNGDSTCYPINGNILLDGIDSVTVTNSGNTSTICGWKSGISTCYTISTGTPPATADTIYFMAPPFILLNPNTVSMPVVSGSLNGYVTPTLFNYWNAKQDTGISWNKEGNNNIDTAIHYLGTSDGNNLVIKVNNQYKTIYTTGDSILYYNHIKFPAVMPQSGTERDPYGLIWSGVGSSNNGQLARVYFDASGGANGGALVLQNSNGSVNLSSSDGSIYLLNSGAGVSKILAPSGVNIVTQNTGQGVQIGGLVNQTSGFALDVQNLYSSVTRNLLTIPASTGFVGINNVSPQVLLDVASTTRGVAIPRMTKTQRDAIVSPIQGEMVFVTDNGGYLSWYNSGSWYKVTSAID